MVVAAIFTLIVIWHIVLFIRPSFPKKKEAPAFHIAQEAVRPSVYFDTNRLRDLIMYDGCMEINPSIARSQLLTNYSLANWPVPTKQGFTALFARRLEQWVMP